MELLPDRLRNATALGLALLLAGCTSIRQVGSRPFEGDGGAVRVRVFADDEARKAAAVLSAPIVGELERREGGRWRPVFRSLEPSWTVAGLSPGRYQVSFSARLNAAGEVEGLERSVTQRVDVVAGELAEVELVLDHVSPAMVAAGAVAIVVAAVLLHEWLDDLDLPSPPTPPVWAAETVFWIALDLADEPRGWVERPVGPTVTSHFPAAGARVESRRPRVLFALSEPLDPGSVEAGTIAVTTSEGEPVPGLTSYDAGHWWIVWEPEDELPAGRILHVALDAEGLAERSGAPFAGAVGFDFESPP